MPDLIPRNAPNRPSPKENPPFNRPAPDAPIVITGSAAAGTILTLTFNQAVALDGTPAFTTDVGGATPVSAEQTAPNVVAITFSAPIDLATSINIPFRDRAIRNAGGGYVTSTVLPIAA